MISKCVLQFVFACVLFLNQSLPAQNLKQSGEKEQPPKNQEFMFTNKLACFYAGQSASKNLYFLDGLNVQAHEFLEDYVLKVGEHFLNRQHTSTQILNKKIIRIHSQWHLSEEVKLFPDKNLLMITLKSPRKYMMTLYPEIPVTPNAKDFITHWSIEERTLFVANKRHLIRTPQQNYPVWLGITVLPEPLYVSEDAEQVPDYLSPMSEVYIPGRFSFQMDSVAVILFSIGNIREDIIRAKKKIDRQYKFLIEKDGFKIDYLWPRYFEQAFSPTVPSQISYQIFVETEPVKK